ncbi:hypothetical protein CRG98_049801 [Punica granatum]|uniref:Uncharacterized protein n=1 Tax=Punica granatum TaxID=22663 RepID=A0A2I0H2L1_PUNGR|nr:hypothetical protein CRG98_049801 [Punica granatum]
MGMMVEAVSDNFAALVDRCYQKYNLTCILLNINCLIGKNDAIYLLEWSPELLGVTSDLPWMGGRGVVAGCAPNLPSSLSLGRERERKCK